jgi:hypothetical protein
MSAFLTSFQHSSCESSSDQVRPSMTMLASFVR